MRMAFMTDILEFYSKTVKNSHEIPELYTHYPIENGFYTPYSRIYLNDID